MVGGSLTRFSSKRSKVQKVEVVKPKRKRRRGPRITPLIKDKTVAKLHYVTSISINPGVAALASYLFRANGCHDPDVSGTGHQPLGWDEHKALYGKYRVLNSNVKITPISAATGASVIPSLFGVYRDPDSVLSYTEATAIIEDPRNKGSWGLGGILPIGNRLFNSRTTSFKASRDLGAEFMKKQTSVSTDPGVDTEMNFRVWCGSINGNDPGAQAFLVELSYVVEFTDPLHINQS